MSEFNEIATDDSGPSMDETIATEWERISKGMEEPSEPFRAPTGKFAKVEADETVEKAATAETTTETETTETAPVVATKKPTGWKPETLAKWDAIDPTIQAEILKREEDFHKGTEGYKEHADMGRKFEHAFRPYEATLRGLNITADVAVSELLKTDHTLRNGDAPQKAAMIATLINQYGIDPNEVFSQFQAPQKHEDPAMQKLYDELNQLKTQQFRLDQDRASQAKLQSQREIESLNSEVSKFSQGKEHFSAVEQEMLALLPAIKAANPASSPQELLQMTYDRAIYANPQTRAALLAKQQEDAKAVNAQKTQSAKAASSVNVRTRGTVTAGTPKETMEEQIKRDATRLGLF